MCYSWFFGALAAILSGTTYVLLYENVPRHPYLLWLVTASAVTFVMYGVDWLFGRQGKAETPETVLHLLTAAGGFVGAWLGRAFFGYKVDWRGNPWMQIVLSLCAVGHAALIYTWLLAPLE
jgi:uncharacterized membrane protein YsdA (DUF1294 family)